MREDEIQTCVRRCGGGMLQPSVAFYYYSPPISQMLIDRRPRLLRGEIYFRKWTLALSTSLSAVCASFLFLFFRLLVYYKSTFIKRPARRQKAVVSYLRAQLFQRAQVSGAHSRFDSPEKKKIIISLGVCVCTYMSSAPKRLLV